VRLITLAAICPDTLRPLSKREVYARAARRAKIEADMARVAKASEDDLPPDEQRQVIDLRELGAASLECAVACACAAPVACGIVFLQLTA
jgi:hypothetical protein